jgi:hypothetical protein
MGFSIIIYVKERVWEGMDWIYLGQQRDNLWAVVIKVKNFDFHKISGIYLVAEKLVASQEGFCSMGLILY